MLAILTLLFLFSPMEFAFGKAQSTQLCRSIFSNASSNEIRLTKAIDRLNRLNPELVEGFRELPEAEQNLENLYLHVKGEGWRLAPFGFLPWKNPAELSPTLLNRLFENSRETYRIDELPPNQIYLFYINSLQAQYIAIGEAIKHQLIENKLHKDLPIEVKNSLLQIVDLLLVFDMGNPGTDPQSVREALRSPALAHFPWASVEAVLMDLSSRKIDPGSDAAETALRANPRFLSLLTEVQQILTAALKKSKRRYCCMSSPGCLFCPNNRVFLRPKDRE